MGLGIGTGLERTVGGLGDARSVAAGASLMSLVRESMARVLEVEARYYNNARWYGVRAPQTATRWAADTLAPFRATSGNNDYGTDPGDAAQVIGAGDTPILPGSVTFGAHRVLVVALTDPTPWKLRFIYGSGTMDEAIAAGQWSEVCYMNDYVAFSVTGQASIEVIMPRLRCGADQLWVQAWNVTNDATFDFLFGFHEYAE